MPTGAPALSVIVPVYREAASLEALCDRMHAALLGAGFDFELLAVCDASPDDSWARLCDLARSRPWLTGIRLPRNVGQHRAIFTGMQLARGSRLAVLDADLQDPPELLPSMLARLDQLGVDAVLARHPGRYQSALRMMSSRLFKRLRAWLSGGPPGAGLHFVMRREVLPRLSAFVAPTPFLVSMLAMSGAQCAAIDVSRHVRSTGRSAYSEWRRLSVALRELSWIILWRVVPPLRRYGKPRVSVVAETTQPLCR